MPLDCHFPGVAVLSVGRIVQYSVYSSPQREVNSRPPLGKGKEPLIRTAAWNNAFLAYGYRFAPRCNRSRFTRRFRAKRNAGRRIGSNRRYRSFFARRIWHVKGYRGMTALEKPATDRKRVEPRDKRRLSVSFSSLDCIDDSSLMTIPWTVAAGYERLDAAQSCKLANP